MDLNSIFSGIGTEIVVSIISLIAGGTVGYKIGFRSGKNQQIQNAGDYANQMQIGEVHHGNESK